MTGSSGRPATLLALAVIVFLEAALVTGLAVWLFFELLTVTPDSFATAIAVFALTLLAAVWTIVTGTGILRRRGWARASSITIQILQIAVAVGCFQGVVARPGLGWALLVPALVAGVLAVTPSVVRTTLRNTEQHG